MLAWSCDQFSPLGLQIAHVARQTPLLPFESEGIESDQQLAFYEAGDCRRKAVVCGRSGYETRLD